MAELRVVRETDRFDEACRFYGDVLGWPVTKQWDEPAPGRIFGYGDAARVELLTVPSAQVIAATGVLISVEVDDVASLLKCAVDHGIEVTQPLADQAWGHRNAGIVDPTGLPIVLFQVIE